MKRKKVLILSPINEYGGINLDVGFISSILNDNHDVKVISLGNYFKNSQVFYFNKNLNYNSLNRVIYNSNVVIKVIVSLVSLIKPLKIPNHFRVSDILKKIPFINVIKKQKHYLRIEIKKADVVFICSQLTAKLNKEIIEISTTENKPIIFKTTGQISLKNISNTYKKLLENINLFIHHSKRNGELLKTVTPNNDYVIIDQNAYLENELLNIAPNKNEATHFFTLSRLHGIKQIDIVIKAFIKINNPNLHLNIYGDGEDFSKLKAIAMNNSNITFCGKLNYDEIGEAFKQNDCLIISSSIEAGPYTAIESMAAATPIISTRVGAMEERLSTNYPYFYDGSIDGLAKQIKKVSTLNRNEILHSSQKLRTLYLFNYKESIIKTKYENAFNTVIK